MWNFIALYSEDKKPKTISKSGRKFAYAISIVLCICLTYFAQNEKVQTSTLKAAKEIISYMKSTAGYERLPTINSIPVVASAYLQKYKADKELVVNLPSDDRYSHMDVMKDPLFSNFELSQMKVDIELHKEEDAFRLIGVAQQRMLSKTPDEAKYIDSLTNWFIAAVVISLAKAESDETKQHGLLIRASHFLVDSLASNEATCPSAYYLWVMTVYSVRTGDTIVDKEYLLGKLDATSIKSFLNASAACAYSLDLLLMLGMASDDDSLVNAVVEDVHRRTDWDDNQPARIYIYMCAEDYFLFRKKYDKYTVIINYLYEIYKGGLIPANIFRIFLLSLNKDSGGVRVEGLEALSNDMYNVRSFVRPPATFNKQTSVPEFYSLSVETQNAYADEAVINLYDAKFFKERN